jgi:ABC-type sugar transport system ATPase subunit
MGFRRRPVVAEVPVRAVPAANGGADHDQPLCRIEGVKKSYGGVHALEGITLTIEAGRVHAIVGENGAGKSTLMKILAGAAVADEGRIVLGGEEVSFANVNDATNAGIATVFQETMLFEALDVFANLFSGRVPTKWGLLNRNARRAAVETVLETVGLNVPLDRLLGQLTLAERQLVEVARALLVEARILILDEPNSALRPVESERLFRVVRRLTSEGVAVVYVSHRLEEVFRLAETVTVMRNGSVVATNRVADVTIPQVVSMMIGRDRLADPDANEPRTVSDRPALSVRGASSGSGLKGVDLEVFPGEIVGLVGLEAAGPIELMHLIYGRGHLAGGEIKLFDGGNAPADCAAAVRRGIAFVPSDRANEGLFLDQSVLDNANHVYAGVLGRCGFLFRDQRLRDASDKALAGLRVAMASSEQRVSSLSGGNQQKVVFGKWRAIDPALVLLEDPTRGVDIGAKVEIFEAIRVWAREGKAVLFSSTDLGEYQLVCDRVIVFCKGVIIGEAPGRLADESLLLEAINTEQFPVALAASLGN